MKDKPYIDEHKQDEAPPSFVKSWKQLYTVVIGELIVLIILFYLFTLYFS